MMRHNAPRLSLVWPWSFQTLLAWRGRSQERGPRLPWGRAEHKLLGRWAQLPQYRQSLPAQGARTPGCLRAVKGPYVPSWTLLSPSRLGCLLAHRQANLSPHVSPQSALPTFSAADWALAVCTHMGGNAGGSGIVAKGTGNTKDLQGALTAAMEFARTRL